MSEHLSCPAILQILRFLKGDYHTSQIKRGLDSSWVDTSVLGELVSGVSPIWGLIYEICFLFYSVPPVDHIRSLELDLYVENRHHIRDVFDLRTPLPFRMYIPRLLLSKIIEAFQRLAEEPPFLDVTILVAEYNKRWNPPSLPGHVYLTDLWPEVYVSHVPCRTCTTIECVKVDESFYDHWDGRSSVRSVTVRYVVEKFHVPSKHFMKQLLVELHYKIDEYGDGHVPASRGDGATTLHKIAVRLADGACVGWNSRSPIRIRESLMLVEDYASDVYGFLDPAHLGTSLTANGRLSELISKLGYRLPVHSLRCLFSDHNEPSELRVYRRRSGLQDDDLRYFDLRRPAAVDCGLILRHLSNSHVSVFEASEGAYHFCMPMLNTLMAHNVSVGELRLQGPYEGITDYRPTGTTLGSGGLRIRVLNMSLDERDLARLIETTDFFRTPMIQGLRKLTVTLGDRSEATSQDAESSPPPPPLPLWIDGIYLLPKCSLYEVYIPFHRSESVARELVQVCEEFERGAIMDTVGHFILKTSGLWTFPFKDANRTVSGMVTPWGNFYERNTWDVYRFQNALSGEWLTACVGHHRYSSHWRGRGGGYVSHSRSDTILHVVKGEAEPDAWYNVSFPRNTGF